MSDHDLLNWVEITYHLTEDAHLPAIPKRLVRDNGHAK